MNIPISWMGFHVAPSSEMTYIAQHLTTFQAYNISTPDLTNIDSPAIAQHLTTFQAHNIPASQIIVHF